MRSGYSLWVSLVLGLGLASAAEAGCAQAHPSQVINISYTVGFSHPIGLYVGYKVPADAWLVITEIWFKGGADVTDTENPDSRARKIRLSNERFITNTGLVFSPGSVVAFRKGNLTEVDFELIGYLVAK
ncbi:MAG TPA: hypothetical protein VMO47_12645 [Rhodothermales bacterium]|nr:hypothetical protein [Rhodothermales bacterium]